MRMNLPPWSLVYLLPVLALWGACQSRPRVAEAVVSESSAKPGINAEYLKPDLNASNWVERFEREARTLERLRHPSIVGIHGFGQSGGYCHLLMEHAAVFVLAATVITVFTIAVTGWTLHRLMRRHQP